VFRASIQRSLTGPTLCEWSLISRDHLSPWLHDVSCTYTLAQFSNHWTEHQLFNNKNALIFFIFSYCICIYNWFVELVWLVLSQQKTLNFKWAGQNNYWQVWTRKSKELYCLNFFTCISHKLQYLFKSRQTLTEVAKVCNLFFSQKHRSLVYFYFWLWI
jgi:hypothetical protein